MNEPLSYVRQFYSPNADLSGDLTEYFIDQHPQERMDPMVYAVLMVEGERYYGKSGVKLQRMEFHDRRALETATIDAKTRARDAAWQAWDIERHAVALGAPL